MLINSIALLVTVGLRGLGPVVLAHQHCLSFIENGEIDDLHPAQARIWEGSAVESGYIAGIHLSKI